jgi:hypothetical protein
MMPEGANVSDLDRRRSLHRQKLRDQSDHVIVALPYTEGELAQALGRLEELLLTLEVGEDDAEDGYSLLPSPFAEREASDAVGPSPATWPAWSAGSKSSRWPLTAATSSSRCS